MFDRLTYSFTELKNNFSFSTVIAGIVMVLVGMTSSAIIVFQAASTLGLSAHEASSWLGSICIGMGLLSIALSMYYRAPVLFAWSTPGAAILVTGLKGVTYGNAVGAFIFSALLIFICGISGLFEKIMNKIPLGLSSALLGGVLFHFVLNAFTAFQTQPVLIGVMFLIYVLTKRFSPRLTMMLVLIAGLIISGIFHLLHFENFHLTLTAMQFTTPTFSLPVIVSIGVPLFIVTMASQNLTGITVMRANHYHTPISPLISWSGFVNLIIAPFGGFAINLAAITAAIGMGEEAHPDRHKRYMSGVVSGAIYTVIGIFAGTVTALFSAFPNEVVAGIAGLALLGTVGSCLHKSLQIESEREASFVTFAVTASGLTMAGIGPAFWGLLAGIFTQFPLATPLLKLHSIRK